ncbi:MAG: hypothetical protein Q4F07_07035 [Bacteroidales bacterium]|nr:hypothetical protein [Bacteroidales bacterium]
MGRYDDIIDLPHHRSLTRKPLPVEARAAQFSSFAALNGHTEAIEDAARKHHEKYAIDPDREEPPTDPEEFYT